VFISFPIHEKLLTKLIDVQIGEWGKEKGERK